MDLDTQVPLNKLTSSVSKWLTEHDIEEASTVDELLDGPKYPVFVKAVQAGIDAANKRAVSNAQKIQKWTFLRKDFSLPGGELGPTLKVKRHVIAKHYSETIEKFYK